MSSARLDASRVNCSPVFRALCEFGKVIYEMPEWSGNGAESLRMSARRSNQSSSMSRTHDLKKGEADMANPAKTKAKLEKAKAKAEADVEVARAKTEAKMAKAKAKLKATEAQAEADVEVAEDKAAAKLGQSRRP